MPNSIAIDSSRSVAHAHAGSGRYYRRFGPIERVMHAFLMLTFIGCALTGVPLLFADHTWASALVKLMGGFQGAALIHRICAAIMTVVFVGHVVRVFVRAFMTEDWLSYFWGPNSLVPNLKDGQDIVGMFKWFFGKGPRPQFDRYTYWEKFDYWAVFWGMFIIGGSGFMLWFPMFFAEVLPGWVFNVAMIVHGEEALLAVGFIFTIHFFNGHLRPEKFPDGPRDLHRPAAGTRIEGRAARRVRPADRAGPPRVDRSAHADLGNRALQPHSR